MAKVVDGFNSYTDRNPRQTSASSSLAIDDVKAYVYDAETGTLKINRDMCPYVNLERELERISQRPEKSTDVDLEFASIHLNLKGVRNIEYLTPEEAVENKSKLSEIIANEEYFIREAPSHHTLKKGPLARMKDRFYELTGW